MKADPAVRWWWASAPVAPLAALARELQAGETPREGLLKASAGRSVWRLPGLSGGVLLKHFRVRGGERWKFLVRPSRAAAEYRTMEAFCRLGLPTVRPLAFGERRERGLLREAWFLGRLVPDARTLGDALDAAADAGDRARVAELAGAALDLTAELHAHPWLHRDLHAHNLLLAPDGTLLVTDLHSVWHVPRLTRGMRLGNLARLVFSMRGALHLDDDAPALLLRYAGRRGEDPARLLADARLALAAFERGYVRGRTARCLVNSSLFAVERVHDGRLFYRRGYGVEPLREDLLAHARILQRGGAELLSRTPRSAVTRVDAAPRSAPELPPRVLKEFCGGGLPAALRQRLGAGRARSTWVGARVLEVLEVPTPQALALLERTDGRAVLVCAALQGARSLRDLAEELAGEAGVRTGDDARRRAALASAVGHLVGRLARAGLRHADLSSKNVLVTPAPAPSSRDRRTCPAPAWPTVSLIDLDGLRRMPPHDRWGLARMLGQLADLPAGVTRTDRARFLRGYARSAGRAVPREVLVRAAARTAARVARRTRRARPVPERGASI